jgi:hypothetical protein
MLIKSRLTDDAFGENCELLSEQFLLGKELNIANVAREIPATVRGFLIRSKFALRLSSEAVSE